MHLIEDITGIITQIAMAESLRWAKLYARLAATGKAINTNDVIALANMAAARRCLEATKEHLAAAERKEAYQAGKN